MMLGGSGKITGLWKVIFTKRVLQYFNAMGQHARQPVATAVNPPIVFSANSSGITGIVRMVTEEKSRIYMKNQRKSVKSKKSRIRDFHEEPVFRKKEFPMWRDL
jgi:phosphoenolpyruvate synthase/pyruvate phosphate dikinase